MGSFLHPSRLQLGVSFLEAIQQKYAVQSLSESNSVDREESIVAGTIAVDFVGKEKSAARISKLELLTEAWLGLSHLFLF